MSARGNSPTDLFQAEYLALDTAWTFRTRALHAAQEAYPKPEADGRGTVVRGLRIPIATVVDMVANGMTDTEILTAYPDLEAEDDWEVLRFAAESVRKRELPLPTGS